MVNRAGVCGGMVEACLRFGDMSLHSLTSSRELEAAPEGGACSLFKKDVDHSHDIVLWVLPEAIPRRGPRSLCN